MAKFRSADISTSGSQLELMLQKNEAKAQELTMTWIDKWNNIDNEAKDFVILKKKLRLYFTANLNFYILEYFKAVLFFKLESPFPSN